MPYFERYLGIDYSGAQTPIASLKGIRVYQARASDEPVEIHPPASPRKYWTRRGLAHWLAEELHTGPTALVGIDHGFSFPLEYFEKYHLPLDWIHFLRDFQFHWPSHEDHMYIDFILDGLHGAAARRSGDSRWRRLTEVRGRAKSVFHFHAQGSVAKSTHAGLPWLLYMKRKHPDHIDVWPFDGWHVRPGASVIAEVYPSLCNRSTARRDRDSHQHDAYSVAAWLREVDQSDILDLYLNPPLSDADRRIAAIEGWILGVL